MYSLSGRIIRAERADLRNPQFVFGYCRREIIPIVHFNGAGRYAARIAHGLDKLCRVHSQSDGADPLPRHDQMIVLALRVHCNW